MNYNYQQWRKECNQYQKNKTEARCANQRKQLILMNNQIKDYKYRLEKAIDTIKILKKAVDFDTDMVKICDDCLNEVIKS